MDRLRVDNRNSWIIAGLAILLPGLGHYYRGIFDKALFIVSSFLFHIALAYTLLHVFVIEQPLTIAFLILSLPYHYFYAIFNGLQTLDDDYYYRKSWIKIVISILLLVLTVVLLLPLSNTYAFKLQIIYHYPMFVLLSIVMYVATHLKRRRSAYILVGRITVAALLTLLAVLLWLQSVAPIQWVQWGYITPIVFLLELIALAIYLYWFNRTTTFRPDYWGVFVLIILSSSTYFVMQYSDYPSKILQSFHAPAANKEQLDVSDGFRYELAPIKLPGDASGKIQFRSLNGYVEIIRDDVEELTLYPILYVNTEDEEQALEVKQQSYIDVNFDNGILMQSQLPLYNLNRYPRMDVKIVIPNDYELTEGMSIKLEHGALHIDGIAVLDKLNIESNSAAINAYDITGNVEVSSKQGNIFMKNINGSVAVQSKKGIVTLINPLDDVQATALNGSLHVITNKVAGDWTLTATVGNIVVKLPEKAHYLLGAKVSFGKISSDSIVEENTKHYETTVGSAIYTIYMYASNYILIE